MQVSVIIPVYRAAAFIAQAVESALAQPETAEVVLVEDGSPDNSLAVCQALALAHTAVSVHQHAGRPHRGVAASRNRGLELARHDFIVFLDADDYFLPGRFEVARAMLAQAPDCDGVYEAMGCYFEKPADEACWRGRGANTLTTMSRRVPPEQLFEALAPIGGAGYCPLAGWTVRRAALERAGRFDETLHLQDDTAHMLRLAAVARLAPGRLEAPVVMRRVHGGNSSLAPRSWWAAYSERVRMWAGLCRWSWRRLERRRQMLLWRRLRTCLYKVGGESAR
jgi:glycosyltransferase involved in cell wall biosynthesis